MRRLESEASKLSEGRPAIHPPVAMCTFVGKAMQSRLDNFAQSGSVGAQAFNYSRFGLPQGLYAINWVQPSVSCCRQLLVRDKDGKT